MYLCLIEQDDKEGPCVELLKQGKFIFRRYLDENERAIVEAAEKIKFEQGTGWYKWIRHSNISRKTHFEIEFHEDANCWMICPTFSGNLLPVSLNGNKLKKDQDTNLEASSVITIGNAGKIQYKLRILEELPGRLDYRHKLQLENLSNHPATNRSIKTDDLKKQKPEHLMSQFVLDHTRRALKRFLYDLFQSRYRANAAEEGQTQFLSSLSKLTADAKVQVIGHSELQELAEREGIDENELYRLAHECHKSPKSAILYDCDDERKKQIVLCPFRNRSEYVCVIGESLLYEDLMIVRDFSFVLDYGVTNANNATERKDDIDAQVEERKTKIFGSQLEEDSVLEIANQLAHIAKKNLKRKHANSGKQPKDQNKLIHIYLRGESGVGKTYFAKCYAELMGCEFHKVNCGMDFSGESGTWFVSTVFGAILTNGGKEVVKRGFFENAAGQVLFLDEIAELSNPNIMLTALDSAPGAQMYTRMGDSKNLYVDNVALVFASNRDLPADYRSLIRRLSAVPAIVVPPLRERRSLILPLAREFIDQEASIDNLAPPVLSEDDERFMATYDWPENVSELERACRLLVARQGASIKELVDEQELVTGRMHRGAPAAPGAMEIGEFPEVLLEYPQHFQTATLIFVINDLASKQLDREALARRVGCSSNAALRKRVLNEVSEDFLQLNGIAQWVRSQTGFLNHSKDWGDIATRVG